MERKFFHTMMFFFLLFVSMDATIHVEAKLCSSPSKLFRGLCIIESNCLTTCEKEGFDDGKCEGLFRQCICFKSCDTSPPVQKQT
ncbi:hypothetical protein CDL12_12515 [Handroanthus impetiginosus]|uniref:Knottins-like domain-containing protein n=1 Tax=Handroanthus impetiginosus TaxID=429701 RepID=A0A2G9HBG0_9LAMI|nr:hypothetical protein CDL12_12515 [Handroanthus impetiginosus]